MLLLAFLNFNQLVRDKPMPFTVYGCSRFFARRLGQTKDLARAFIEPIFQILHAMLLLNLKVFLMGARHCFSRQSFHVMVNIPTPGW